MARGAAPSRGPGLAAALGALALAVGLAACFAPAELVDRAELAGLLGRLGSGAGAALARWLPPRPGPPAGLGKGVSISPQGKAAQVAELWTPHTVARLNDHDVKVVKIAGEFTWHSHAHTDEMFVVITGSMELQFAAEGARANATLSEGQLIVVPKGEVHRPVAAEGTTVMIIEREGVVNTGDAPASHLTATQDLWI